MRTLLFVVLVVLSGAGALAGPSDAKLELKNPRYLEKGVVTGGQPSAEDLVRLREQGIKTVINLRGQGEVTKHADPKIAERFNYPEDEIVKSFGMNYFHIPVSSKDGLTPENAKLLDEALKAAGDGVLVHCGSGNRVGAMMALRAFHVQGKEAEEALAIGKAAGLTSLEPRVRDLLSLPAAE
ncbi:MAG: protein tyrosine phosphatase family protein [Alphaproteobacteria bacterium]|nr:protein tyrosine phosphatase family protein [Alphaproteobacteria bacterium]